METRDGNKYLEDDKIINKMSLNTKRSLKEIYLIKQKRTQNSSGNNINPKLQSNQEFVN